ncbi:MAG: HNH endonuclease [Candidatus Eisenbacteria bacterium]|nr:HNH endonuclease [Candidatus Eisenbacteria bacterium]
MKRPNEFSRGTMESALARQANQCASCGTPITWLGEDGRLDHRFGESGQAHHLTPVRLGGTNSERNCVILCQACHYSAHEGGNYAHGTVLGHDTDFPHYAGGTTKVKAARSRR